MPSPPSDADVTLLFFAKARELVGAPQASVSVPAECSGAQLRDRLVQVYPQLATLQVRRRSGGRGAVIGFVFCVVLCAYVSKL